MFRCSVLCLLLKVDSQNRRITTPQMMAHEMLIKGVEVDEAEDRPEPEVHRDIEALIKHSRGPSS